MVALRHLLSVRASGLPDLVRLQTALTKLLRTRPEALLDAVGTLDALVPLLASASGALPARDGLRRGVPHLLAALAPHLDAGLSWRGPTTEVRSSGFHRFAEPLRAVVADRDGVGVELSTGRHLALGDLDALTPSRPLVRGELGLVDTNPLANVEAHPDKQGNVLDLGGRDAAEWVEALNDALAVIEAVLPDLYAELEVTLLRVVPVGYEPERHLSASYREAPGLIYLTLHPDPLTLAEAIVHETQHGKLNLLTWLDPVLNNGHTEWSPSPVRPDLRPIMGVLLAAHAFVPVAALHQALGEKDHLLSRTPQFARRRAEVLQTNAESLAIVQDRGELTPVGARVMEALWAVHAEALAAVEQDASAPRSAPKRA